VVRRAPAEGKILPFESVFTCRRHSERRQYGPDRGRPPERRLIWASLLLAPARLMVRPSVSPSQPSRSASAMCPPMLRSARSPGELVVAVQDRLPNRKNPDNSR